VDDDLDDRMADRLSHEVLPTDDGDVARLHSGSARRHYEVPAKERAPQYCDR